MSLPHYREENMENVKSTKYRDVVRTSLAYLLSNLYEENFPLVAEIQAADVQKNDAYLVKMARDVISEIERRIKILEEEK